MNRWSDLLASFRATLFAVHSIPDQPFLHLSLSVGLAALKLPACYAKPTPEVSVDGTRDMRSTDDTDINSSLHLLYNHRSTHTSSHPLHPSTHSTSTNYDPSLLKGSSSHLDSSLGRQTIGSTQNPDCPVCDSSGLGTLAKECPWSHHLNSIIVCGLTGRVVQDGDRLAVLPNGRVYSRDGLERLADGDEGRVRCPRTGQVFGMDEIRRVFIS